MLQASHHVDPSPRSDLGLIVAQRDRRFASQGVHHRGRRGSVLGKFLAGRDAEKHRLEPLILVEGAAEGAIRWRLDLACRQAPSMRSPSSSCTWVRGGTPVPSTYSVRDGNAKFTPNSSNLRSRARLICCWMSIERL